MPHHGRTSAIPHYRRRRAVRPRLTVYRCSTRGDRAMSALTLDPRRRGGVTEAPSARVAPLSRVVLFYVITFAVTWALFLPLVFGGLSPKRGVGALLTLGIAAPTVV